MNSNFNNVAFHFAVIFSLIFVLSTSIASPGGVDLLNYKVESRKGLLYWDFYQGKEFISWALIKLAFFISDFIGMQKPILALNLFIFIITTLVLKKYNFKGIFLALALISPFGVLLSQNVLRQYISCIFLFLFLIKLVDKSYLYALFLALSAFFSHHSSAFFILTLFLSLFLNKHLLLFALIFGAFFTITLLKYFNYDFGINAIDSGDEVVGGVYKFISYLSIMIVFWLFKYFFTRLEGVGQVGFYRELSSAINLLFVSVLILSFFELPYWVLNRFILTLSFIIVLYIIFLNSFTRRNMVVYFLFYLFLLTSCFLHPGVKSILLTD